MCSSYLDDLCEALENNLVGNIGSNIKIYKDAKNRLIGVNENSGTVYNIINKDNKYDIKHVLLTGENNGRKIGYSTMTFGLYNNKGYALHQHTFILMSHDRTSYKMIRQKNDGIVACHVNNCPFDNVIDNLEWGTYSDNNKHGKIVASLEHYNPGIYTIPVSNKNNNKIYYKLKQGIKNEYIQDFRAWHNNQIFNITDKYGFFPENDIDAFIDYLYNNFYWAW